MTPGLSWNQNVLNDAAGVAAFRLLRQPNETPPLKCLRQKTDNIAADFPRYPNE
jgi:hypothetical protein